MYSKVQRITAPLLQTDHGILFCKSATRNSPATANRPWHHALALAALQELHHKSRLHVVAALHYR